MPCRRQSRSRRQLWPPPRRLKGQWGTCIVGGYRKQCAAVYHHEHCPETREGIADEPLGAVLWCMLLSIRRLRQHEGRRTFVYLEDRGVMVTSAFQPAFCSRQKKTGTDSVHCPHLQIFQFGIAAGQTVVAGCAGGRQHGSVSRNRDGYASTFTASII